MILITGANGLLGRNMCRHFVLKGYKVRALKRANSNITSLGDINEKIDWVEGDLLDAPGLAKIAKGIETVVHCAAMVSYQRKDRQKMFDINVGGTENIINASILNGVDNFVHVSSVGALGRSKEKILINESQKWEESESNTEYGYTKYKAELEVFRGQAEGLNTIIINPSVILGPADWNRSSARIFQTIFNGQKFFTNGIINFVDVRDVSEIALKLLQQGYFGERYIINADTVPNKLFLSTIAESFNKPGPNIEAGNLLLNIGRFWEILKSIGSNAEPLITNETIKLAQSKISFDNKKIVELLNFEFRSLKESIRWTCQEIVELNKVA